jgi:hypothetical protein
VASLLIIRRGRDVIGQCDELCYDAKHDKCVCRACGGSNHGLGYEAAVENTRRLVAEWDQPGTVELADDVQNLTLFPLPQE